MRICIHKATKHILEMQSHATEGTLIGNAVNAGYSPDDVEEVILNEVEYGEWRYLDENSTWNGTKWVYNLTPGKAAKLAKTRADASTIITAKYPLWYQTNVSNGIYAATIGDAMKAGVAAIITESNRCEDLVDAATTEAEINAVTPNWPVL